MSIIVKSGAGSDLQTVDPTSKAARASLYDAAGNPAVRTEGSVVGATQGYLANGVENDGLILPMRADRYGGIGVALGQTLLYEPSIAASVNTARWVQVVSGSTITQTIASGILLNANSTLTAAAHALITSGKLFQRLSRSPLEFRARAAWTPRTNAVLEMGFGNPVTNTVAVNTGAFFRSTGPSNIRPVVSWNGSEVMGNVVDLTTYVGLSILCTIVMDDNEVAFRLVDAATDTIIDRQKINIPSSNAKVSSIGGINAFARQYNSGTPPASAAQLNIGEASVTALDQSMTLEPALAAAVNFESGDTLPATGLQSGQYANSAAPANAALSNTAAGYSTLGGLFGFLALAGAATDFALFNYVPAKDFICTGIHISAWNTVAAVATTPTLLVWGIGHDGATVNLSTGMHRRVGVGAQSFPIGAAVGATADREIDCPIEPSITRAGRSLTVILRVPVGTATATEVIAGLVNVRGYHL